MTTAGRVEGRGGGLGRVVVAAIALMVGWCALTRAPVVTTQGAAETAALPDRDRAITRLNEECTAPVAVPAVVVGERQHTIPVPLGQGDVADVVPSRHAQAHDVGTFPASEIRARLSELTRREPGRPRRDERPKAGIYYSKMQARYLGMVRHDGMCGGMVFQVDGEGAYEFTCFGGSECMYGSCQYWDGVIVRDAYRPITLWW